MYGYKSWTIKKAGCRKIDAFELWYWRRLLRVPWTARRSNQSILKEISPGRPLGGLMLKLKLQYFGYLMGRTDSKKRPWFWERLRAGREGGNKAWFGWMISSTQWTWIWANSRRELRTGEHSVLQSIESQRVGHNWAIEQQHRKIRTSQVVLVVKNLPANAGDKEMQIWSLSQEDPLKEGVATHSNIIAWRIPWT